MKKALRDQILAFNRSVKEKGEKAADLDVIVAALGKLPPGQLKKLLTEDVLAVLEKYGIRQEEAL